jgi:hypothetical protein
MALREDIRCIRCGEPAAYRRHNEPDEPCEELCEECARFEGAREHGEKSAALEALGFAIALARKNGMTDSELAGAFHEILTAPHSLTSYPVGGDSVLGSDFRKDEPWRRPFLPLLPAPDTEQQGGD